MSWNVFAKKPTAKEAAMAAKKTVRKDVRVSSLVDGAYLIL
jgi:hypothetical protein